jgi:hypothetical protein
MYTVTVSGLYTEQIAATVEWKVVSEAFTPNDITFGLDALGQRARTSTQS